MRLVLLGAVRSTEVALRALVGAESAPAHVIALDTGRAARHSDFVDVAKLADDLGIESTAVATACDEAVIDLLRRQEADLLLVIGWSEILPVRLFEATAHRAVGYHPSRLPELRGRAAIPWTVLLERRQTAGTLFWMTEGLDDGDIAYQRAFSVDPSETASTLYNKHMDVLADMVTELAGAGTPTEIPRAPQTGAASYCAQRKPIDGLIDWRWSAEKCDRLIRATTHPYPGARSFRHRDAAELCVWSSRVEPEGSRHYGVPGQVVAVDDAEALVTCGSGVLRLCKITDPDGNGVELRIQDRFLPISLALQQWADRAP